MESSWKSLSLLIQSRMGLVSSTFPPSLSLSLSLARLCWPFCGWCCGGAGGRAGRQASRLSFSFSLVCVCVCARRVCETARSVVVCGGVTVVLASISVCVASVRPVGVRTCCRVRVYLFSILCLRCAREHLPPTHTPPSARVICADKPVPVAIVGESAFCTQLYTSL
jgi:hypothetical protein